MKPKSNQPQITSENLPQVERDALLDIFPNGVVTLDLETSGLSPLMDKIVEISAIKITPSEEDVFSQLVNPEIPMPEKAREIHGISDEMVANEPKVHEVLPRYFEFWNGLPLIAHNAMFDMGFIVFNAHKFNLKTGNAKIYCSCKLGRRAFKEMDNHRLGTMVKQLNIPLENAHRAFDDALACMRVYAQGILKNPRSQDVLLKESYVFFK